MKTKKLLGLCGSARTQSKSFAFLQFLKNQYGGPLDWFNYKPIHLLPLYHPQLDQDPLPASVKMFHSQLREAEGLIIVTPEYLHSIPATLKNAFEWCNRSSILANKKVYSICYTPKSPRGKQAKQNLDNILQALKVDHRLSELLHHSEISFDEEGKLISNQLEIELNAFLSEL